MYKLTNSDTIIRLSDEARIPRDTGNTDYTAFLAWVGAGNTPQPADVALPPAITEVTMYQARTAMLRAGLLPAVEAALTAMPGQAGDEARIKWEFAGTVSRSDALVQGLIASLNLSSEQVDTLFAEAALL